MGALVEYQPAGESGRWQVLAYPELAAEFSFGPGDAPARMMTRFHAAVFGSPRWLVVRRLFGIGPTILPMLDDPREYRRWSRAELKAEMGLGADALRGELDAVRAVWRRAQGVAEQSAGPGEGAKPAARLEQGDLPEDEDEGLLARFGFSERFFEVPRRGMSENLAERARFISRLREMRAMLEHPAAGPLARGVLVNELMAHRIEADLLTTAHRKDRAELNEELQDTQKATQALLTDLDKIFPWKGLAANGRALKNCVAEFTQAFQDYHAKGDRGLIDGLRTAAEVEVELRQSQQAPEPRLRLDSSLFLLHAMFPENLWDPNYKPPFAKRTLKKWQQLGKAAIEAARQELSEPLMDLEAEHAEYQDTAEEPLSAATAPAAEESKP